MKYINYDGEQVKGIYDSEIHSVIPEPNFAISDDVWQAFLSDQSSYKVIEGQLVYTPVVIPEPTPEEIRDAKLAALNTEYDPQRLQLERNLTRAVNYWQDSEVAGDIRREMDDLEIEYAGREEAIWNEYNESISQSGGDEPDGSSGDQTLS